MCSTDIFLGVLALIFPPLPVWVKTGICSCDSLINILLCMLGFLPGLLHSWYIIAKFPEPAWEYEAVPDAEAGHGRGGDRVAYVFVRDDGSRHCHHHEQPQQHYPQQHGAYSQQPSYQTMPSQGQYEQQRPQYFQAQTQSQSQPKPQPGYGSAPQHPGQESGIIHDQSQAGPSHVSAPPNDGSVPPSYAEAVGDNKIQSRD